jgi:hypothetical protein
VTRACKISELLVHQEKDANWTSFFIFVVFCE